MLLAYGHPPLWFFVCVRSCYYGCMLQDYLLTYLKKAKYERIDSGKLVYAEIKALRGVWATGKSKDECRKNLASTLEGWIIFRLRRNLPIPNFKIPSFAIRVRDYA